MVNGKKMKPKMMIPIWNLLSVSVFSVSKDHPFHHLFVNNVSCDISGISLFLNNLSLMCNNFHQADLLLTACSVAYYVGCHFPSFVNSDQCCVGWYCFWKNYYPAMSLFFSRQDQISGLMATSATVSSKMTLLVIFGGGIWKVFPKISTKCCPKFSELRIYN